VDLYFCTEFHFPVQFGMFILSFVLIINQFQYVVSS
jgi:hypothetical protein